MSFFHRDVFTERMLLSEGGWAVRMLTTHMSGCRVLCLHGKRAVSRGEVCAAWCELHSKGFLHSELKGSGPWLHEEEEDGYGSWHAVDCPEHCSVSE